MMDITGLHSDLFANHLMGSNGSGNMLKGGITFADKVSTVSETYAEEIQTMYFGEQLDALLCYRREDLYGIVNGIDYDAYNPMTDDQIACPYDVQTFVNGKAENKKDLQRTVGLPEDEGKFVVGIISRLTDQKGLDLIDRVMNEICHENLQFIVLGTGEQRYEDMFRYYENKYPDKVSANILYSDALSKKIYAGADAILMPSLFEPCGLCQLMALRYGTVPIVRETGGLKDTVEAYDEYEKTGNGFSFANYNAHELLYTIQYAVKTYYEHREDWNGVVKRGMLKDYSWIHSAKEYEELYHSL
jgi:starch synthase